MKCNYCREKNSPKVTSGKFTNNLCSSCEVEMKEKIEMIFNKYLGEKTTDCFEHSIALGSAGSSCLGGRCGGR